MADIKQIVIVIAVSVLLIVGLSIFIASKDNKNQQLHTNNERQEQDNLAPASLEKIKKDTSLAIINTMNPIAVFKTNKGTFEIELFEDTMPITVKNFKKLAEDGFYDGTKFHRVIDGFMIQGGDPDSKGDDTSVYGQGGPGYTIQDEFVEGKHLTNTRGTISMANTGQPNSGGSQFFINTVDNTNLDFDKPPFTSKHPVFGHVVSGMDVVDAISSVETGPGDLPVEPVVIESVTIKKQ